MTQRHEEFEPGIYFDLPEIQYHAAAGLSCSGMKQLAVSPLNYWHLNLNPDYERPEETYPQRFGKAVHCRLLEPERFRLTYAPELSRNDFPGLLETVDDLKAWLSDNGLPTSGKKKQDLVDRAVASGLGPIIWDIEREKYESAHAGKVLLSKAEVSQIERVAEVVASDLYAPALLTGGMPEVSFFVRDPESGVLLKARMDYVRPNATIDVKTFSNSRGKPTDRAVFDAIYYEGYHLQCVVYRHVRELARQQLAAGEITAYGNVSEAWLKAFVENDRHGFGFVFIESSEPYDLRTIQLRREEAPGAGHNVYWVDGQTKMELAIEQYAECLRKFGDNPWRESRQPHILADQDIPQLMFA